MKIKVENIFFPIAFLYFDQAFTPLMQEMHTLLPFENSFLAPIFQFEKLRILFLVIILTGNLILLFPHRRKVVQLFAQEKFLWILLALAIASVLWSSVPSLTLSRTMILLNATLLGSYFAVRYREKEQLRLLAWTFGVCTVLSFAFIVFFPDLGVMAENSDHPGTWQGLYNHKNVLGRSMVLSALVFFLNAKHSKRYSWASWVGLGLSVLLILGTTSKSALLILILMLAMIPAYKIFRWCCHLGRPALFAIISITTILVFSLILNAEYFLGILGRDITLTDRTKIWSALLDRLSQHIWLGYGYGGFWQSGLEDYLSLNEGYWQPPNGHNGFLDLWVDLGLVGLAIFTLSFIATIIRWLRKIRSYEAPETLLPLAYLIFLFLTNLTESSLLTHKSFWLLYVAMALTSCSIRKRNHEPSSSRPAKLTG